DVLAFDRDERAGLALEAREHALIVDHRRLDELDRDALPEHAMARADDDAHAARAEHFFDGVLFGDDVPGTGGAIAAGRRSHAATRHDREGTAPSRATATWIASRPPQIFEEDTFRSSACALLTTHRANLPQVLVFGFRRELFSRGLRRRRLDAFR